MKAWVDTRVRGNHIEVDKNNLRSSVIYWQLSHKQVQEDSAVGKPKGL